MKFLDYAWVGNVSEDFRVCFTWNGTGIKTWQDFLARPKVNFGNTGVGTSAYIDDRILSELFGVKLHVVDGLSRQRRQAHRDRARRARRRLRLMDQHAR